MSEHQVTQTESVVSREAMKEMYPFLDIDFPKEFESTNPDGTKALISYGKLIEPLGTGASGDVYKIKFHPYNPITKVLGPFGAVKILDYNKLDEKRNAEMISRFKREGRLGEALEPKEGEVQHPNLLRYPDHGSIGRNFYLIMELIKNGHNLNDFINETGGKPKKQLSIEDAARIMFNITDTIDYLQNRKGIVHRDISPANIYVGDSGLVKLIDFGLGRMLGDDEEEKRINRTVFSKVESVRGTPHYLSPEAVETSMNEDELLEHMGERDVWGVGAVLYSLIAGHPPYVLLPDESIWGLLHRVANVGDRVKPLKKIREDVPFELDGVVNECLIKDPKLRINAAELNKELKNLKGQFGVE